jgi:hypothetical protein
MNYIKYGILRPACSLRSFKWIPRYPLHSKRSLQESCKGLKYDLCICIYMYVFQLYECIMHPCIFWSGTRKELNRKECAGPSLLICRRSGQMCSPHSPFNPLFLPISFYSNGPMTLLSARRVTGRVWISADCYSMCDQSYLLICSYRP